MSYKVMMLRSDDTGNLMVQKEYQTQIPMKVIAKLALIEKQDWLFFRDSPYNIFGEFIYHNLSFYEDLAPYISKKNCRFEFIYEYLTDDSLHIRTNYYYHDKEITKEEYVLFSYRKYYLEQWMMVDPTANRALMFFECEYIPS